MIKTKELSDPVSCLNRAIDCEMLFVLLARDVCAPATIRFWCAQRVFMGKNTASDPQILEALQCADSMESQQRVLQEEKQRAKKKR